MVKKKKVKHKMGRPFGTFASEKKVVMTFRIARDVAEFLDQAMIEGKSKTAIIENAIRKTYFKGIS